MILFRTWCLLELLLQNLYSAEIEASSSKRRWCRKMGNMADRGREKSWVLKLRLNEPIDGESLMFCRVEFHTVKAAYVCAAKILGGLLL